MKAPSDLDLAFMIVILVLWCWYVLGCASTTSPDPIDAAHDVFPDADRDPGMRIPDAGTPDAYPDRGCPPWCPCLPPWCVQPPGGPRTS